MNEEELDTGEQGEIKDRRLEALKPYQYKISASQKKEK